MKNASTCTGGCLESQKFNAPPDDMHIYAEITEALLLKPKRNVSFRIELPLRKSLFPRVAPYVKFRRFDSKHPSALPTEITNHLKFLLKKRTPYIVRETLNRSGCSFTESPSNWYGTWGVRPRPVRALRALQPCQKVSVFPGSVRLSRKDRLWTSLKSMMTKFGRKPFDFVPFCYILPREGAKLKREFGRSQGQKWILKPPECDRGDGVRVVNEWRKVPKFSSMVAQRYLSDPRLIRGRKFDLRLYVLVTSFDPLRVYLFSEGLVRFATVRYINDGDHLDERCMHLTNTCVNATNGAYRTPSSANSRAGDMWSLEALFGYLREERIDVEAIWDAIKDAVIKTLISAEASIGKALRANASSRYSCYELFGFDVILDRRCKPWLLEVNCGPSMRADGPVERAIKGRLIRDVFNVAGYQVPDVLTRREREALLRKYSLSSFAQDSRLYEVELSAEERRKQDSFVGWENGDDERLDQILEELTPDDVRLLVQYEDELTQIGDFQKIFPTARTRDYLRFFESPGYYNALLDAWENFSADSRIAGIERLQKLCAKMVHLAR